MAENEKETRSLALTPTWSVALVLTIFVAVSLLVERSIHRLSNAQAMKEQAQLREEMAYQYKVGNFEAAAAIQRRLDPDVAM
ncbi:hypothetical protein VitviT2T_029575 [Vitis vinifera]|uniref:Uncharacterized protein n=1 Tax=Vitis vinifera TaxID=29760 RepID=A0ABY9DZ25_VITVI|nr:MLO-like protein 10 [Vitis vinifera]WKA12159.1 hypothetical protein VitviT2T_029575 [Vitis vinifera]|eukprot:XP_010644202.1 PREDICTED: MLO-like protein 10 [Vitis vinifera]